MANSFDVLGSVAIVKFPRDYSAGEKKKSAVKIMVENKSIKTILEKVGKFKGRLRKMKTTFVAGEKTKEVLYRENGCAFRFNDCIAKRLPCKYPCGQHGWTHGTKKRRSPYRPDTSAG